MNTGYQIYAHGVNAMIFLHVRYALIFKYLR